MVQLVTVVAENTAPIQSDLSIEKMRIGTRRAALSARTGTRVHTALLSSMPDAKARQRMKTES